MKQERSTTQAVSHGAEGAVYLAFAGFLSYAIWFGGRHGVGGDAQVTAWQLCALGKVALVSAGLGVFSACRHFARARFQRVALPSRVVRRPVADRYSSRPLPRRPQLAA
jgi:hypothetical protein